MRGDFALPESYMDIPYAWFMPGERGVGRDCDWTTAAGLTLALWAGS